MAEKTENYKGFVIAWQEPPLLNDKWAADIGSGNRHLFAIMGGRLKNIDGQTREDMLFVARQYIDDVLMAHGRVSA